MMSETSLLRVWLCGCTAGGAVLSDASVLRTEAVNGPGPEEASSNCPDTEHVGDIGSSGLAGRFRVLSGNAAGCQKGT
jgi:hypothetical protein